MFFYLKAVFVDRFNRTLLDLNNEPFYIDGKACWLNHIDTALENYNRVHRAIRVTPFVTTTINKPIPNLIDNNNDNKNKPPNFQVGKTERVSDKRNLFSKSYKTNWNREHSEIQKINNTSPVT